MDSETDSGCVVGTPSSIFTIDSEDEGEISDLDKKDAELQNPIYPRPTPAWQLPITRFFNDASPLVGRYLYKPPSNREQGTSKEPEPDSPKRNYPEQGSSEEIMMEVDEPWIGALKTLSVEEAKQQQEEAKKQPQKKRGSEHYGPPAKKQKQEE